MATQKKADRVAMTGTERQLLTFTIDGQEYALAMPNVVQVVRMVAITPSPKAPKTVKGMINVRGKVIPVISLRERFALPEKVSDLNDHLLIAQTDRKMAALSVDRVSEVLTISSSSLESSEEVAPEVMRHLAAVAKVGDRILLILDLDKALDFEDSGGIEAGFADAADLRGFLQKALAQN